jgi:hypothetical protein
MAKYVVAELPIPTDLMDKLMVEVYADVKKEREGSKPGNSQASVAAV